MSLLFLGGVEDVEIAGKKIVGRWKETPTAITDSTVCPLLQTFANWGNSIGDITRFTAKYGPLGQHRTYDESGRGMKFEVSPRLWSREQARLRAAWDAYAHATSAARTVTGQNSTVQLNQGEALLAENGALKLRVTSLRRYLEIQLAICPIQYLHKCPNPDCQRPYFITENERVYCGSDACKAWGKRRSNLGSWHRHKAEWSKRA